MLVGCDATKPPPLPEFDPEFQKQAKLDDEAAKAAEIAKQTESVPYEQALEAKGIVRTNLPKVEMVVKNRGKIVIELVPDLAPKTCEQIMRFINDKFYDGMLIHRVENFCVQWGDPLTKDKSADPASYGSGSEGDVLPFEENLIAQTRGVLAMARKPDQSNGTCQVYVLKTDSLFLNREYVAFGKVIEGMDVVDKCAANDVVVSMKVR